MNTEGIKLKYDPLTNMRSLSAFMTHAFINSVNIAYWNYSFPYIPRLVFGLLRP